ncbi:hypothetical protein [Hyphomicrobium sp.]|uniref:hypothetical protein n=1 Tax=Hyphomicrobium sp. TaxID=82 RepID=UPI000FC05AFB|nr:hypothetical protein [Hyphomicrobium sp.]RUP08604.1 MAG: hypothetical protein EKK38_12675 [Hyphomicrobium sp.]
MTNSVASELSTWSLLAAVATLMAFQVSLYTLVGRERKAPYVINSVFGLFLLGLTSATLALCAALVPKDWDWYAGHASAALLLVNLLATCYVLYRFSIRFLYFVDDWRPKYLPIIRHFRHWKQSQNHRPTYAHDPLPIDDDLRKELTEILSSFGELDVREALAPRSLAVATEHQAQANKLVGKLAMAFFKEGLTVQYLTASRHPIEFVSFLEKLAKDDGIEWRTAAKLLVVIDAYTPHFGFADSIYAKKTKQLETLGVQYVWSSRTYAGMHTATSKAFKKIESRKFDDTRKPTLVVYEDCYALVDVESIEQYRVFVRHVLPSERMWDAMFSVFIEAAQADADWSLLHSYASMKLDLRVKSAAPEEVVKTASRADNRRGKAPT